MSELESFTQQVIAAQLSAQAFVAQAELLIQQLQSMAVKQRQMSQAPSSGVDGPCPHPKEMRDYSLRTMGHAKRFRCLRCNTVVDDSVAANAEE